MADPLTIIGCVGGLCNVIDCATKAISALNRLRNRWETADLAILTLASQLMALRAALSKLQTWSEHNHPESLHYQLVMDLDGSVEACQILISKLEAFVSSLETSSRPLDFSSRLKIAFGHGRADHIEKLLQQQTSALTLLLTVLNSTTPAEQQKSLKKLQSVKRIGRSRLESASLFCLRDSDSFKSTWSDNLSRLSMEFSFDTEIFTSGVYHRTFRNHARRALRQPRRPRQKALGIRKVLLLGDDETGKDKLVNRIHETHLLQCGAEDIASCHRLRFRACYHQTLTLIQAIRNCSSSHLHEFGTSHEALLREYSPGSDSDTTNENSILKAMKYVWRKAATMPQVICEIPQLFSMPSPQYFLREIKRLALPDTFPPTPADALKAQAEHKEHDITLAVKDQRGAYQMTIHNVPDRLHYPTELLARYLETVDHVFVVIDMTSRKQDFSRSLELLPVLARLVRVRKRRQFFWLNVLFTNLVSFKRPLSKLSSKPIFPGSNDKSTVAEAIAYIESECSTTAGKFFIMNSKLFREDSATDLVPMIAGFQDALVESHLRQFLI